MAFNTGAFIVKKDNSTPQQKIPILYISRVYDDGTAATTHTREKAFKFEKKKDAQKLADKIQGEVETL
jgi:hypothetical protein